MFVGYLSLKGRVQCQDGRVGHGELYLQLVILILKYCSFNVCAIFFLERDNSLYLATSRDRC